MSSVRPFCQVEGFWMVETEPIRRWLLQTRGKKAIAPSTEDIEKLRKIRGRIHMRSNSELSYQTLLREEESAPNGEERQAIQREALERFFKATWGWLVVEHWMMEDLTLWNGLRHDDMGQALLEINLSNNNINGPLPPELGTIRTLRKVDLSGNKFTGPIPEEWGNLASLEELVLARNRIAGPVTGKLRKLSSLRLFDLSDNWIDGAFPAWLDGLGRLNTVRFGKNDLTGPIPTSLVVSSIHAFTFLVHLTELSVPYNQLSGVIPSAIGNLANLLVVDMESNQLSGPMPESLGQLKGLEVLNLRWNELTGSIPESLSALTSLTTLRLNHNKLTGGLPESLSNLSSLEEMNVTGNQLQGDVPKAYQSLSKLTLLAVVWNELTVNKPDKDGIAARKALRKLFPKSCMVVCVMEDADAEIIKAQEELHAKTRKSHQRRRDPEAEVEEPKATMFGKGLSLGRGLLKGLTTKSPKAMSPSNAKQQTNT